MPFALNERRVRHHSVALDASQAPFEDVPNAWGLVPSGTVDVRLLPSNALSGLATLDSPTRSAERYIACS
jgi:hypothetical protein